MVKCYAKGARAERELIKAFSGKGFSVIRAAGSGVSGACPDLLAFKRGMHYAFECKSWSASSLAVKKNQFKELLGWEDNTGITTFIAWKIGGEGWRFVKLSEMNEAGKHFTVTESRALLIDRKLEDLF